MIISQNVAADYKAREKAETKRMDASLTDAIAEISGSAFLKSIFTRPANPMKSNASWFLACAFAKGSGMTQDGVAIRFDMLEALKLSGIVHLTWMSEDDPSLVLFASSDASAVVGRLNRKTGELLVLPLALQLRGTLKDEARTSIKQVFRTGDLHGVGKGVFLTPQDAGEAVNVAGVVNTRSMLSDLWRKQAAAEIEALFAYQAERPLICRDADEFEPVDLSLGWGLTTPVTALELSMLRRTSVHDSHLHMGFRSFSDRDAQMMKKALDLAVTGWFPQEAMDAFATYSIALTAGSPYQGTSAHIAAMRDGRIGYRNPQSKNDLTALLAPVEEAIRPMLDEIQPEAMFHLNQDTKASWVIASISPAKVTDQARLEARKALENLLKK